MPILVSANWMPSDVTEIDEELMLKCLGYETSAEFS